MLSTVAQATLVCGGVWLFWKLVRRFVVKTTLDNLPGPESPSFLYGACQVFTYSGSHSRMTLAGNLKQIYNKQGWDFHRELGEKYGPVSRLHGKFGVRPLAILAYRDCLQVDLISKRYYTCMTRRLCTPLQSRNNTSTTRRSGS